MPSGKYNRIKGHVFERDVAKFFRSHGWKNAQRNLREVQAHHAVRHHDLEKTAPFAVQCKATEAKHSDARLIDGVKLDLKAGFLFPILVRKRNKCQPTVTMKLEDLTEVLRTVCAEGQEKALEAGALVTVSLEHFGVLLTALRKSGAYPKHQ